MDKYKVIAATAAGLYSMVRRHSLETIRQGQQAGTVSKQKCRKFEIRCSDVLVVDQKHQTHRLPAPVIVPAQQLTHISPRQNPHSLRIQNLQIHSVRVSDAKVRRSPKRN